MRVLTTYFNNFRKVRPQDASCQRYKRWTHWTAMEEIGYLMVQIFVLLLMAEVFAKLFGKLGMPDIIGFIFAGIVFVNLCIFTDVGAVLEFDADAVLSDNAHFLNIMGQLGLVFLLFGIGLETRLSDLMAIGRKALVIAVVGILFPFIAGFCAYFLFGTDPGGAVMMGTTIFAMSAAVAVKLLQLMGVTDSKLGRTVIGIAVFSDIICLILLAVNSAIVDPVSDGSLLAELMTICLFVVLVFLFIAHTGRRMQKRRDLFDRMNVTVDIGHRDLFTLAIVLCLAFTAASFVVGLSGIVGAFLAGMYLAEFEESSHIREKFETLTKFMLPFFFITVGLRLRLDDMTLDALYIGVVVGIVAVLSKYAGGYVGARVCRVPANVSGFIASCMVARGDIAVIVATLALSMGLITTDMYAGLIIMAVITQVVAPALMRSKYSKLDPDDPLLKRDERLAADN